MALSPTALLSVLSAGAMVGLGLWLLRLTRSPGPPRVLGILSLLWGAQIILIRAYEFAPVGSLGRAFAQLSQACILPLPLLMLHFAAIFPTRLGIVQRWWWLPAISLPSVAGLVAIVVDYDAGVRTGTALAWGWGATLLLFLPFLASLVVALARLVKGYAGSPEPPARPQLLLGSLGVLVFLGPFTLEQALTALAFYPDLAARLTPAGVAVFLAGVAVAGAGTVGLGALGAWHATPRERSWWMAALLLPISATAVAFLGFFAATSTFWRLAMVLVLAYAIAKYRLFDLDVRLRTGARQMLAPLSTVVVTGLVAALLWNLRGIDDPGPVVLLPAALVGGGAGVALRRPLARRFDARFPHVAAAQEYLERRKLEVYRAAVEAGLPEPQRAALATDLGVVPSRTSPGPRTRPSPAPLRAGAVLAGRYEVRSMLARGLHGRLALAWDRRVGEPVVLKEHAGLAGTRAGAAFAREARLLGELDHPNVIGIRDVFREGGSLFVAMEHADGGSLSARLDEDRALPEGEALAILAQVLEGLAAAHRKGIVHRDVKPSNVLFKGAKAKVADFGVAFDPVLDAPQRGASRQPGTAAWMAPEQALGRGASPASDVYAAGAVLFRMLAGRHYLDQPGAAAAPGTAEGTRVEHAGEAGLRWAITREAPSLRLPASPATLRILECALAKDPTARYPDAKSMLRDVRRALRVVSRHGAGL